MATYIVPSVNFQAVDENEEIVPLPAKAVEVRVLITGQILSLTTDAEGYSPRTEVTINTGPFGVSREPYCLYMVKHQGIGRSVLKALEGPV
jgi:hypothetical protein